MPEEGVPFTAIVTISDPTSEQPVFNDMRQNLQALGTQIADIRTAARITPRVELQQIGRATRKGISNGKMGSARDRSLLPHRQSSARLCLRGIEETDSQGAVRRSG